MKKKYLIFLLVLTSLWSCQSNKESTQPAQDTTLTNFRTYDKQNYPIYNGEKSFKAFLDQHYYNPPHIPPPAHYVYQYICIEGKIAKIPHQHMMKGDPMGKEQYLYIDCGDSGRQLVGYYRNINKIPEDDKLHYFFGELKSIAGTGKGGGAHTEYYINLDYID